MAGSSAGRLVDALLAPTKAFNAIAERPTWLLPLIVMLVLAAANGLFMTQRLDFEAITRQAFADRGATPDPAEIEQAVALQEKIAPIFGVVNPLVFGTGFFLLGALVFWVAFKMLGSELTYRSSLAAFSHAFVPTILGSLLNLPVVLRRESIDMSEVMAGGNLLASNLGALASEEASPVVRALLSSADVFSVWVMLLLILGYSIVGRVSRGSAAVAVVVIWLLGVGVKVGLAALSA
jgi:hypothetical protein